MSLDEDRFGSAIKQYTLYTFVLLTAAQFNGAISRSLSGVGNSTVWLVTIVVALLGYLVLWSFTSVPPAFRFDPVISS